MEEGQIAGPVPPTCPSPRLRIILLSTGRRILTVHSVRSESSTD